MKIYIINMASSVERKDFQRQQAEQLGLSIEFFTAITPTDFSQQQYEALYETWERPMFKGEIACFLSHKALWQKILDDNQPAVILEDDAILSKHTQQVLQSLQTVTGIDRVNLEVRTKKKIVANTARPVNSHAIRKLYLDRSGSAGYVLWPSGARKLLQIYAAKAGLADKVLRHFELDSYQIEPAVVVPADYCPELGIDTTLVVATTINPEKKKSAGSSSLFSALLCKCRRIGDQFKVIKQQLISLSSGKSRLIQVDPHHF